MEFDFSLFAEQFNGADREVFVENLDDFLLQQQIFSGAIKEMMTKLEILDEEFSVLYDHNPIHHMEYRLKTPRSIVNKLKRFNLPLTLKSIKDHIYDVAGVRVITYYERDIYQLRELLLSQEDIELVGEKDYIEVPKANGYRSLHLVVNLPVYLSRGPAKMPVEIQLRTVAMDFWASLEHEINYKYQGQVDDGIRYRLKLCAENINSTEREMEKIYNEVFGK